MAGFGVIVFALDFSIPPAAGKNIGAGKFVDATVFGTQDEPAVFVRAGGFAGEADRLGGNAAHQDFKTWGVQIVQAVQNVQIVSGEFDTT